MPDAIANIVSFCAPSKPRLNHINLDLNDI